MAQRAVHGTPYATARALAAWAVYRRRYLRGRLLLAGVRIEELDMGALIDVAEAAIVEAAAGPGVGVDTILDALEDSAASAMPNEDTWGTTAEARRGADAAHAVFGQAPMRE